MAKKMQSDNNGTHELNGNGTRKGADRGFAAMSPEKQREIARKGGEAVSRNRAHMASIGRKGGEVSHGGGGRRPGTPNEGAAG